MKQEDIFEIIRKRLQAEDQVTSILVFGSLVDGSFSEHSDIDIAIQSSPSFSKEGLFTLRLELENLLNRDVDLVEIKPNTSMILLNQIARKSVVLYAKNPKELDSLLITLPQMYIDFKRTRKSLDDAYIERKLND
ncbi:MAG: nucleotidyltransferase domain-containing protein [Bdellovibrionota bacterium]